MATRTDNQKNDNDGEKSSRPNNKRLLYGLFVFMLSAWMFFLGVLVGRGTAPVSFDIQKLQRQIAELKQAAMKREKSEAGQIDPARREPKAELDFYDALKKPDQPDPLDSVFPEPEKETRSEAAKEDPMPRKAPEKKPEKTKPREPKPSVAEKEKTGDKPLKTYSIQIASSKDRKDADKLVEIFIKKGYPAYRASAELKAVVWHRVRIGPFKSYSDAYRTLARVKNEKSGALIIEHGP